jgi:hypothetical protein
VLQPGLAYVSQGGQVLHVNPGAAKATPRPKGLVGGVSSPPPFLSEYEPGGRYEMVVKKLTPAGKDYEVELELVDQAAGSKPERYRGIVTVPTVKFDTSDKRLSLKVASGSQEMQMELHGDALEGPLWWTGRGEGGGRKFVPTQLPAPGSADAAAKERLGAALALSLARKYDDAQAAYGKIEKDFPNTPWALAARAGINGLRELKDSHIKLDETRKAEEAALNKTKSLPNDRPPVARSNDRPSKKPNSEDRTRPPRRDRRPMPNE